MNVNPVLAIMIKSAAAQRVAALRSRQRASFRLLELLRDGRFEIAVSVPLVLEYEAVLVDMRAS